MGKIIKLTEYLEFLQMLREEFKAEVKAKPDRVPYLCLIAQDLTLKFPALCKIKNSSYFSYFIQQGVIDTHKNTPPGVSIRQTAWVSLDSQEKLKRLDDHIAKIEVLITQPRIIYNKGKAKKFEQPGRFIRLKDAMKQGIREDFEFNGVTSTPKIKQLAIVSLDYKRGFSQVDVKKIRLATNNKPIL